MEPKGRFLIKKKDTHTHTHTRHSSRNRNRVVATVQNDPSFIWVQLTRVASQMVFAIAQDEQILLIERHEESAKTR